MLQPACEVYDVERNVQGHTLRPPAMLCAGCCLEGALGPHTAFFFKVKGPTLRSFVCTNLVITEKNRITVQEHTQEGLLMESST